MTLELKEVSVTRGGGPVITGVSLSVVPGQITSIIGPNGAGKTSLLEAISGVIPFTGGSITLDGADLKRASRRQRARMGLTHVEQGRTVFPSLTVRENVMFAAHHPGALDDALDLFPELGKRLQSPAVLLSGGEQQMVVLARAFAAKPAFLLVDEMSLGLAPVVFLRLIPVITSMAESGVGVLLVEQFAHLALRSATESLVVAGGNVTYRGPASALLEDPDTLRKSYLG